MQINLSYFGLINVDLPGLAVVSNEQRRPATPNPSRDASRSASAHNEFVLQRRPQKRVENHLHGRACDVRIIYTEAHLCLDRRPCLPKAAGCDPCWRAPTQAAAVRGRAAPCRRNRKSRACFRGSLGAGSPCPSKTRRNHYTDDIHV